MVRQSASDDVPPTRRWGTVYAGLIRECLSSAEPVWLPLDGSSMAPFLANGCRVRVEPPARIRMGDVVVYEVAGAIVCHRVLWASARRGRRRVLMKGDARRRVEGWVERARVVGVVTAADDAGVARDLTGWRPRLQALAVAVRSASGATLAALASRATRRPGRRSPMVS